MKKMHVINLAASAIVIAGGLMLSDARPAQAMTLNPCTDLTTAVNEASDECFASGGKSFRWSGSCSSSGYTLSTVCSY